MTTIYDNNIDTQYNFRLAHDDRVRSGPRIEIIVNEILYVVRECYGDFVENLNSKKDQAAKEELARALDWKHYLHALNWMVE